MDQKALATFCISLSRYRRSYDSEYTAPLIAYHIWPALIQGDMPLIKGEACTRRGAVSIEMLRLFQKWILTKSFSNSLHPQEGVDPPVPYDLVPAYPAVVW